MTSLIAVAMLALLADHLGAQTAERPDIELGDQWDFAVYYTAPSTTPNRTWVITSVSATGVEGVEDGEPLELTPEVNVVESNSWRFS